MTTAIGSSLVAKQQMESNIFKSHDGGNNWGGKELEMVLPTRSHSHASRQIRNFLPNILVLCLQTLNFIF